jgi:hypothetical protein
MMTHATLKLKLHYLYCTQAWVESQPYLVLLTGFM